MHILDLYCLQLLNAVPFCKTYTKLYFDAKHLEKLEKGLNKGGRGGGGEIFGALFSKKVPFFHKKVLFLANIACCPKFLEYALYAAETATERYCTETNCSIFFNFPSDNNP